MESYSSQSGAPSENWASGIDGQRNRYISGLVLRLCYVCALWFMFVFGISKSTHTVRVAIINLTYNLMHILSTATVVDK